MTKQLSIATIIACLTFLTGCTAAQRSAIVSGSIVAVSVESVTEQTKVWIDGDQQVIDDVGESFGYLAGRAKVYECMDQAAEIVPIILQRRALWERAKKEAYTLRDGLYAYEERSGKTMPPRTSAFITEVEAFIAAMDKAIDENDTNVKVQFVSANMGRIGLIASGVPELAVFIPSGAPETREDCSATT